jgi:hypothetical protein
VKKKALVDIDDVLIPTQEALLAYVNAHAEQSFAYHEVTREMREHAPGEYLSQPDLVRELQPFPHSAEALRQLYEAGYEIHIATARKEGLHEVTEPWLEEHGLLQYVYEIHPRPTKLPGEEFKREVALSVGIDVAFDDTQSVIEMLANSGVFVYAIDCPWNSGELAAPAENVTRAPDLGAAVDDLLSRA